MAKKNKKTAREELELDQAYAELTGYEPHKTRPKKAAPLLFLLCILTLILVGCTLGLPYIPDEPPEPTTVPTTQGELTIPAGLHAAGIDLGGMTADEAAEALRQATQNTYTQTDMVLSVGEDLYTMSPADSGVALDIDAAVEAMLAYTGTDTDFDLIPYLNLDRQQLRSWLDGINAGYVTALTETSIVLEGEMPDLTAVDTMPDCQTMFITLGTSERSLATGVLLSQILDAYNHNTFLVETQCIVTAEPAPIDLAALYDQYCVAPTDAVMDMETFEVSAEAYGYDFDLTAAQALLDAAVSGDTIEIPFRIVVPEVSAESLSSLLFRDVLASVSTKHTNDSNRNNNLRLACKAINGMVLYPGEVFYYNRTLGERTLERGYLPAGAYLNGQTIQSVGGGICQVSSTLYYSVLQADLEIVYRANHGMTVGYVPLGMDATVDWGKVDFRFRNNTDYPIRLEASVSNGKVHVRIIGTDLRDYYVEMEYDLLETYEYDTIYQEFPPDNEEGYKDGDVITSPTTGYKVKTYRCKYDRETGKLISREYEATSVYNKRDAVVVKIVEPPTEPTEPTEPETEPTEPETEPTEPETEPTEPETEPTEPETEPTEPETEPTEPETEPTEPETESTTPETEPSEPETEPSEPETEPSEPETEPSEPVESTETNP